MPFLKVYKEKFNIKLLGPIKTFVSIDFTRDRAKRTIEMSQARYIGVMVPKHLTEDELARVERYPAKIYDKDGRITDMTKLADVHGEPLLAEKPEDATDRPFLSMVASKMYATQYTRGDLAIFSVFLARFGQPGKATHAALKFLVQVMNYMYHSRFTNVLTFGGLGIDVPDCPTAKPPLNPATIIQLHGMLIVSDGSWLTCGTYCGYFILLFNAAIDWGTKLVKVKMSSAEAEVGAGSIASKRGMYVRQFLGHIMQLPRVPTSHIVDASALPAITENLGVSKKTEHFFRWLHYMRFMVTHGYSYVHLCRTFDMWADAMTKVSDKDLFCRFIKVFFNLSPEQIKMIARGDD